MVLVAWVDYLQEPTFESPMRKTLLLLALFSSILSFAQESILKDFAEERRDVKLCFYPSTLRMINIKKDPNYYELVNDVEKLLIYIMDSGESTEWTDQYRDLGYEEYIAMYGKVDLVLLGKDEEYVGLSGSEGRLAAFYLRGAIAFQKIPELIKTFQSGDMLSLIKFNMDK